MYLDDLANKKGRKHYDTNDKPQTYAMILERNGTGKIAVSSA
jgi:hypothetical protein